MFSFLEKKLIKEYFNIAGLDEAGRGPLAGPVVAAAVTITDYKSFWKDYASLEFLIKDSKALSARQRAVAYALLREAPFLEWGIGRVSERVIDRINILAATKLAMLRAINQLNKKIISKINFLLIDGNLGINLEVKQQSVAQGDKKIFLIAAASIVAKVTRDRMMIRYSERYPDYQFERHKGYGTKKHIAMIRQYNPCPLHRRSFEPIKTIVKKRFL